MINTKNNDGFCCPHVKFQRNVDCNLKPLERICENVECNKTNGLLVCFQCDSIFCPTHYDLHLRPVIEEKDEEKKSTNRNEKNESKLVEKVEEYSFNHYIYLEIDTCNISCYKCNSGFIHPLQNIHGICYRFITEFYEKEKKYPPSVALDSREFLNSILYTKNTDEDDRLQFSTQEEYHFLSKTLLKLVTLGGRSGYEGIVCDFIQNFLSTEITPKKRNFRVLKSEVYGMCVIDEPIDTDGKEINTILIDGHIDQVCNVSIPPVIFPNQFVMGTGFDDRVSVAVMLTMIKYFVPQSSLRIVYLFSKMEECGYIGFRNFFLEDESISELIRGENPLFPLSEIICLDVTYGKMHGFGFKNLLRLFSGKHSDFMTWWFDNDPSRLPGIGDGIIVNFDVNYEFESSQAYHRNISPLKNQKKNEKDDDKEEEEEEEGLKEKYKKVRIQSSGIHPKSKEFRHTNLEVMRLGEFEDYFGSDFPKGIASVVVVDMHDYISFCSLLDVYDLFRYMMLRCRFLDSSGDIKKDGSTSINRNPKNNEKTEDD